MLFGSRLDHPDQDTHTGCRWLVMALAPCWPSPSPWRCH